MMTQYRSNSHLYYSASAVATLPPLPMAERHSGTTAFYFPTDLVVVGQDHLLQPSVEATIAEYKVEVIPVKSASTAINVLGDRTIAAVLINLNLLGAAAYDVCAEIRHASFVPIIIVSSDKRLEELVESYEAGADHYIVMPFAPAEIVARIGATKRRMHYTEPRTTHITLGDLVLDPVRQEVWINDTMIELTTNESRLLHYLVRNPNRAVRTEDLLQLLWGEGTREDLSVVRTTMHRLRNKIERNPSSPKYLKTVFGLGYRFCV